MGGDRREKTGGTNLCADGTIDIDEIDMGELFLDFLDLWIVNGSSD